MKKLGSITNLQAGALIFTFIFSSTIAFLIGPLSQQASTTGGWCLLIGGVIGLMIVALALRLYVRHPTSYVGEYGRTVLGKVPHAVVLLLISFFLTHLTAFILREFTDFFVLTYLRETPSSAVAILVMMAIAALTQAGMSAVFRFAQGTFLFIGLFFLVKPLFFISELDSPIWHELVRISDWRTLWTESYRIVPWMGELVLLVFFIPQFAAPKRLNKAVWWGGLAGMYILIAEYLLVMLFFGPKLGGELVYPVLELAGFIHLGDFIQNMDAIAVSIWFTALFIKLSVLFASGTYIASQAFGLKDYKTITLPLAALVVLESVYQARNPTELADFFQSCWPTFALSIESLPFLYPLVGWVKQRFRKRSV